MKILIIQQKMIGDVLTSSMLFEILRAEYPEAILHYMIYKHTLPVVENSPFIDEFIVYEENFKKPKLFLQFLKKVRQEKYDVVIDVYSKIGTALISIASGAPLKISYKKWYTEYSYSHPIPRKNKNLAGTGLAITHRLALLKPLIKNIPLEAKPKIYLTEAEINNAKEILLKSNMVVEKPLFMISVVGSALDKTYPAEYLANLLDQIAVETNSNMIFNYIPSQKEAAENIYELCQPQTQKNIDLKVFGKSLREFLALTSQCDAIIGNEGGAVNMARALNIPTFAIFSPAVSKEDWSLFENDLNNISVHLKDYKPYLFDTISKKQLRDSSAEHYRLFTPDLIRNQLSSFLQNIEMLGK